MLGFRGIAIALTGPALGIAVLTGPLVTSADAQVPTITVEPTSGPAGTTVTVSGSGCPQPGWGDYSWLVHVQVRPGTEAPSDGDVTEPTGDVPSSPVGFTAEDYIGRADAWMTAADDGTWSVTLTIPGGGPRPRSANSPAVPGDYPISALCYANEGAEAGMVSYRQPVFTVTGAAEPSEPSLPLARTGPTGKLTPSAMVLIVIGVVLSGAARRLTTRP